MSLTTTNSNNALTAPAGGNPFLDAAEDMGASSGSLFLRFDGNTGIYTYGKDQDELPKGTKVAVNHNEFRRGWICWNEGEVMEEKMVRIVDGAPPAKGDLADHGPYEDPKKDGWREQASAQFRDIESGEEFLFKTSSKGGRIATANLVRDFGKGYAQHPGELAIVALDSVSFDAKDEKGKKLGRKYAPAFKIVAWQDEAELIAKFAAQAADSEDGDAAEETVEEDVAVNTGGRRKRAF